MSVDEGRRATEEHLRRQMDQELQSLQSEFADLPSNQVTEVGEALFDRLRARARITDYIPVLVHRYAREDLLDAREARLRSAV
jgi:hypothetical protein